MIYFPLMTSEFSFFRHIKEENFYLHFQNCKYRPMKPPKFLSLLQTLSSESFQRFRRYLQYHAPRSNQYTPVMDFLASIHPKYEQYKGDLRGNIEEILLAHEAKSMDNKRRGNFLFRLTGELENFLAIEQLKHDPNTRRLLTLQALRQQGAALAYNEALEDAVAELAKQIDLSTDHHYAQLRVFHEAYYNTVNNKLLMEDYGLVYLQGAREQLQLFFQKLDLKYQIELESRGKVVRSADTPAQTVSTPIVYHIAANDAFFQLYQMVAALQQDPLNEELFQRLVQLYREEGVKLNNEDQSILLKYLKNASAKLLRNGSSLDNLRLSFELADLGWRYHIFDVLGGYTTMNFLNYVEIAVALEELDWLEQFIQSSIRKVPKNQQKEIESTAKANLHFGRKQYDEALILLRATKSKDEQLELRIRMLYCKIFYETKATDALLSMLKSFDTYLRRSGTYQPEIVQGYLNFLKLLRLIANRNQPNLEKLAKLLPITAPLYGRIWLEHQLATKK